MLALAPENKLRLHLPFNFEQKQSAILLALAPLVLHGTVGQPTCDPILCFAKLHQLQLQQIRGVVRLTGGNRSNL
jgi:hypothetical protein